MTGPAWPQSAIHDAQERIAYLEAELAAIRDLAYCGVGNPADALKAIQQRASRALPKE